MNSDTIAEKFNLSKTDAEQFIKLFTEDELKDSRLFVIDNNYQSELEFLESLRSMMPSESYGCWDEHCYPDPYERDACDYIPYTDAEMIEKYYFGGVMEKFYKSCAEYYHDKIYITMHNDNFIDINK